MSALVHEGLIFDDSPGSVELHYLQRKLEPTGLSVLIEVLE